MTPTDLLVFVPALGLLLAGLFRPLPRPALLLLLAGLTLHLVLGTPRWQMVAAYLAAVLAAWAVWHPAPARRVPWRVALQGLGVLLLGALAAGLPTLLPLFQLPAPDGPQRAGTRALHWGTAARPLNVQVWYPTPATSGTAARYVPDSQVTVALSQMFGLPGFALSHLRQIRTNALQDAAPDTTTRPVLLFFHGLGSVRGQNTFQAEMLASHGYLVVGVDVPGFAAVTLDAGGRPTFNTHPTASASNARSDAWMSEWAATGKAALDALARLRDVGLSPDLSRVGVLGHSFGGGTAAYLLRTDDRVKAALDMDGGLFGQPAPTGDTGKPFFMMSTASSLNRDAFLKNLDTLTDAQVAQATGGETPDRASYRQNYEDLLARRGAALRGGGWALVLPQATHLSFTDATLYSPLLAGGENVQATHRLVNAYTLAFFDSALRGKATDLKGLQAQFPEARFNVHE